MATWTEKQIAALTGADLERYNMFIAMGLRPADALNQTIATRSDTQQNLETLQSGQPITFGGTSGTLTSWTPTGNVNEELPLGAGGLLDPNAGVMKTPEQLATQTQPIIPTATSAVGSTGPTADQRSAFALFKDQLAAWGLEGLTDWATQLYQSENAPVSYNEFYALMKQQPVYQERFGKTNAARTAAGLSQLTENEIMKLESQYRNIMKSYNLPANFYDSPEDYRKFIANDLSAAELADRVQAANAYVKLQDRSIKDQLRQYYGIDDAALTAFALDPAKGQSILDTLASKTTSRIAAATAGLGEAEAKMAMGMGAEDLSFAKQAQAFGQAAQAGAGGSRLSAIYGDQGVAKYGTPEAITESFGGPTAVQEAEKRRKLARMEQNVFGGGSGVGGSSLGGGSTAGAI